MYFEFQESKIWEGGNPLDPNGKKVMIRAKSENRARRKLPKNSSIGRHWILISFR